MNVLTAWLASLLTPIIQAAVTAAVNAAFEKMQDKAEVSKPHEQLQKELDDLMRGSGT